MTSRARGPGAPAGPLPDMTRPVRRRTVALEDGALRVDHLVPCRPSGGSSPLSECATCARRVLLPEDPDAPDATVTCHAEARPNGLVPASLRRAADLPSGSRGVPNDVVELALRTPVGEVVAPDVLAVAESATIAVARSVAHGAWLVLVDAASKPVGLVAVARLFDPVFDPAEPVASLARPFEGELHDETALVHAIAGLVGEEGEGAVLPVVDDEGALLAVLSPVDVVRWLAARSGYAPAPPPAASSITP